MEKGEIAHFEQFHLFPQCFPKVVIVNVLKRVYMEERVKAFIEISCVYLLFSKSVFNYGREDSVPTHLAAWF